MKKVLSLLVLAAFIFSGCSSKGENLAAAPDKKTQKEFSQEDEFLDEFSDELVIEKRSDPLKSYNEVMTQFNDSLYENVLHPVADGYRKTVNKGIRKSIGNLFYNLLYPQRLLNNILQGKFVNAMEETQYFLLNSTLGFVGLFDVAKEQFDLKSHPEDFGQTLGVWGVGSGMHVVLPVFGPSNLRDIAGIYPDYYTSVLGYVEPRGHNFLENTGQSFAVEAFDTVNDTSLHINDYHVMKEGAIELYPYLRDMYEQYRDKQIKE
jgi:phospholipid-binding lipoprotein MlaA